MESTESNSHMPSMGSPSLGSSDNILHFPASEELSTLPPSSSSSVLTKEESKSGGAGGKKGKKSKRARRGPPTTATSGPSLGSSGLFSHLEGHQVQREGFDSEESLLRIFPSSSEIHPAIFRLGQLYSSGVVRGTFERSKQLLLAFMDVVRDYRTPESSRLCDDLEKHMRAQIQFLIDHRRHSLAMGNVIRYVRTKISHTSPELTDSEAKEYLLSEMATFLVEKLTTPTVAIAQMLVKKVRPGEVLLTFAYSSVISLALRKIWEHVGSDFEIVVVDARPLYEGKKYVRDFKAWREEFPQRPLPRITYCSIASVDFMFTHKHVTKVLLPCSSVLSNGAVLSRAGTSLVASTAHYHHAPVIFCAHTFKFVERVLLDSIVHNEMGDRKEISEALRDQAQFSIQNPYPSSERILGEKPLPSGVSTVNLRYDLTAPKFISVFATEFGFVPTTSVPVILREMDTQN